MILFYTASQDATIYLQQPYQNTGIDEMLEISKVYYGDTPDTSRVLLQFDTTEISKSIFELQNTKLQTISSSIYSNNLISSSWSSSVSASNYLSASYNTTSQSLFIANASASVVSASLFTYTTITATSISADYLEASQSIYNQIIPNSASIAIINSTITGIAESYSLMSSSYFTLNNSALTSSITDNTLSASFNAISQSYVTQLEQSASLLLQSSSLKNEIDELNVLFNIAVNNIPTSASIFAGKQIPQLQASASILSASISTLNESANIKYLIWQLAAISSSTISSSYNAASQSTLTIIQNGGYNFPFSASLQLKITKSDEIAAKFNIEAYPISQSWENGTGTRFDKITTNGATWYYKNGDDTSTIWNNTYVDGQGASFNPFTTGSQTGLGGTWFTSSVASQSFQYTIEDINLDVTSFVKTWNSGSITNNGIILKLPTDKENDSIDYGSIKMFSKETNTIYQPKLVITYLEDDVVGGDLTTITDFINSSSYDVSYRCYSPNLKTSYREGQKITLKIDARELYPVKQFNTTFAYQVKYYLPSTAYYSVIDTLTKETIIGYSDASRVIQGEFNNLIKLNFQNWPVGRNYTLLIKSIDDDNEEIFEIGTFDIYK